MTAHAGFFRRVSVVVFLCCALKASAQGNTTGNESAPEFRLALPVDEVVLTFHAEDAHGVPVDDLKKEEIKLWDNGVPPRRIVAFDSLPDRPMRIGFLLDTSASMQRSVAASRSIAERFVEQFFRQKTDQAFVMDFGYASKLSMPWTNKAAALAQGLRSVRQGRMNPLGGTARIDTVFRARFHEMGQVDPNATANLLLVFSDGEDNASHTSMDEALAACQHSNTAIYAFRVAAGSDDSTGPKTLAQLASRTGGRVFPADDTEDAIERYLKSLDCEARSEYRLAYDPAQLKHDGTFHTIEIQPPDRVERLQVRTGYYAPTQ